MLIRYPGISLNLPEMRSAKVPGHWVINELKLREIPLPSRRQVWLMCIVCRREGVDVSGDEIWISKSLNPAMISFPKVLGQNWNFSQGASGLRLPDTCEAQSKRLIGFDCWFRNSINNNNNNKIFVGGEDGGSSRDLVLRSAVHGCERLPHLAQAEQEGPLPGEHQSPSIQCTL